VVRLVVEDGAERRAFRLGKGRLTIGSAQEAQLVLRSPGIAAVHAELELDDAGVRLRPRPGVLPPRVAGAAIASEVVLHLRQPVEVGQARLWLEGDEGPLLGPNTPQGGGVVAAGGGAGSARSLAREAQAAQAVRRQAAVDAARKAPKRSVVQRSGAPGRKGIPTWLSVVVILAVAGGLVLFLKQSLKSSVERGVAPVATLIASAERALKEGDGETALVKLDLISDTQRPTPDEEARIKAIRAEVQERKEQVALDLQNQAGTNYFNVLLERYEERYLQGSPDPAKVRLFLERCAEFQRRWPKHPQLDWVQRHETRFRGFVDPNQPPTWADVDWEVKSLVDSMPRDYRQALAILDAFLETARGEDEDAAEALRAKLVSERAEYAADRLQQARYEFEKDQVGKAVWWLVHSVIWLGDPELENDAAARLLKIEDVDLHLKGYRESYPEKYEALLGNPVIREYAREKGLL